jgi:hypothetical protein
MRTSAFLPYGVLLFLLAIPPQASAQSRFVNEVADGSASDVGYFCSLALDASGNPHVSYLAGSTADLKYARKSGGVWTTETADAAGASLVGWYTSIALDVQGNPHVSYYDETNDDLKYARKSGGAWTAETVDASSAIVGLYTSLGVDAQGNPHVSYYDDANDDLKYARKSGGAWTTETVDASSATVGLYTSLALDAQGNPHVSYYDAANGNLKYARKRAGFWTTQTADGSAPVAGYYTSLALDAQGNPHVSYQDQSTYDLKYARRVGGAWTIETADGSANSVGYFTSLALDAQGNIHVSYLDQSVGDLKYARKSGGAWTTESADGSGSIQGQYTSLALDPQGNPHVSYFENGTNDLKFADAGVHFVSPVLGLDWPVGSRQEIAWSGVGTVDLYLSSDGGSYEEILADNVMSSPIVIRVPHIPSRFARLTLLRSSPFSTSTTDSFFTIKATIALLKFDASAVDGAAGRAVRLSWETEPGPEADVRYRIERAASGFAGGAPTGEFAPIHAGLLDGGEYLDAGGGAPSRYRLVAVNGLGEEYVLGETASAPALGAGRSIVVTPNVARDGEIQVTFRVASDFLGTDVAVFDASGRLVRGLASGVFPAGIRSVTWDGRDDRGERASAGVYFVRLAWGGQPRESARVTLVR